MTILSRLFLCAAAALLLAAPATSQECVTAAAGGAWQTRSFAAQTGVFTAELDATPSLAPLNSVVGLAAAAPSGYADLAAIARFNPSGQIDARNGGTYAAAAVIPYTAGVTYHFRMRVDTAARRYSLFVTPAGGTEQTVGADYAFRTEQSAVTSLAHWGAWTSGTTGQVVVCGFTLSTVPTPTPTPAVTEVTPPASGVTASTHDGNLPANTVDNNVGTRWSGNGNGAWIQYDLGSVRMVSRVQIAAYNGNARQNRFDLLTSSDGATWAPALIGGLTSGTTTREDVFDIPDAAARYVRYVGHGSTVGTFNSVTEVSIFAATGPPLPTPTPTPLTPTPTPVATPTPTPTVPGTLPAYCANYPRTLPANGWESNAVRYDANGRLVYQTEAGGNRIPDFSYAGYRNGTVPIPNVAERARVNAAAGDDTARIQAAIDQVGALPVGADGYRGAVVLGPGRYEIGGVVRVNRNGVVLRGSGQGGDPASGTILVATGTSTTTRVVLGTGTSSGWDDEVAGTRTNITTSFVAAGSRSFDVASAAAFAVGDPVVVVHPDTQAWYNAIDGGGVISDPPWAPGTLGPLRYKRRIVSVSGNRLTLDAPVFNHLDRSVSQSYVFEQQAGTAVSHVGIENLRVDSEFTSGTDEAHARSSIQVTGAEDAWIRDVTTLHFIYGGVHLSGDVVRITVERCSALDPVAQRTGGRMYNFVAEGLSQLALFTRCHTRNGRHPYVTQASGASGIVFHRSVEEGNNTSNTAFSEGHRRWSQGLLYDRIQHVGNGNVHLGCRGDTATSHGWGAVHSVIWNPQFGTGSGRLEKPPTAQNWGIGDGGPFSVMRNYCPDAVGGHIEQDARVLRQESLYEAQMCDRLR